MASCATTSRVASGRCDACADPLALGLGPEDDDGGVVDGLDAPAEQDRHAQVRDPLGDVVAQELDRLFPPAEHVCDELEVIHLVASARRQDPPQALLSTGWEAIAQKGKIFTLLNKWSVADTC